MMARTARLAVMMLRPPVAVVVLLFAALGMAQAEHPEEVVPLCTTVLLVLAGWLVNATVLNDLSDEAIDRVNLARSRGRPLVAGVVTRRQLLAFGLVAGGAALVLAALVSRPLAVVVAGGLVFNALYSLRPVRLAERGVVAPLVLPLGLVAVPYLVGVLSVTSAPSRHDLALLPGLYLAFIGRIVLKDFRDAHGDAMFGKWTFLLRHGRRVTCAFSAACWVGGVAALVAALPGLTVGLVMVFTAYVVCALHGLVALARGSDPIGEQVVIGAIAQAGRAVCITALAQITVVHQTWTPLSGTVVVAALGGLFVHSYLTMFAQQGSVAALQPY